MVTSYRFSFFGCNQVTVTSGSRLIRSFDSTTHCLSTSYTSSKQYASKAEQRDNKKYNSSIEFNKIAILHTSHTLLDRSLDGAFQGHRTSSTLFQLMQWINWSRINSAFETLRSSCPVILGKDIGSLRLHAWEANESPRLLISVTLDCELTLISWHLRNTP